ncbi:carbohydrate ABC transporter membrane protein 2 (CUT1 family) [Salana multivorans]|uniref:Carbohydrate ABC transporter membrane protein 2 (CUT1 family) n=1 Tax=Salana multivorans TaxID=120377 RepID=A0A3N2DD39_9MICO|nr:carbohydrate ABC transporter permease [Salana multivorans]ROR97715.1 carbohydrate ABC transporter membrane protein 2 (CUT1 family) [Salana multivorans]
MSDHVMTLPRSGPAPRRRRGPRAATATVLYWVTGIVVAAAFAFPLVWALLTALKPRGEAAAAPPTALPSRLSMTNFSRLWEYGVGLDVYLANSLVVAAVSVVATVIAAVLLGYALAHVRFRGAGLLFALVIAVMMVPFPAMIIAVFQVLQVIGLYNSLIGLALVYATYQLPFAVFLMRNAFRAVPTAMREAAVLDGAGTVRTLWSVMLPIVRPAIITVGLFAFIAAWNEFFAALIVLTDAGKFTLPLALMNAQTGNLGTVDWGAQQAGVIVASVPVMVLFLFLQRYYVRGIAEGAVKS